MISRVGIFFITCFCFSSFAQTDLDWFIKAKLFKEYKQIDSAIYYVSKAIKINQNPVYYKERAELYGISKNYNKAVCDYILISDKSSNDVRYRISCNYALMDSLTQAANWLQKYLSYEDKLPKNVLLIDSAYIKLKKTPLWNEIWKKNWFTPFEDYLGELFYIQSKGKNDELFDVIDSALKYYPDKAELWVWRSKAFTYGNNPKESMKSLDMAIKCDPTRTDVMIVRAEDLRKEGKSKKAINDYNFVLEIEPWNMKVLKERGKTKIEAADYSGAITDLLKCSSYDKQDELLLYYAGHAAYLKGDLKQSIELFTLALKGKANSMLQDIFFERGRSYYDMMDYEKAFSDFCMAIDLNTSKGEYFYYRGLTYYAQKNKTGACHDWEKAKKLDYLQAQEYMLRFCGTE